MQLRRLRRPVFWICAVAAVAGCGGGQSAVPAGVIFGEPAVAANAGGRGSWMARDGKDADLLYVADPGTGGVIVYSYQPPKYKFVGFLTGAESPAGECVDAAQNVYVTNHSFSDSHAIFKYAHGGTNPIGIFGDPAGEPIFCSVDPKTGNLAVVDYPFQNGGATLAIYEKARGKPRLYGKSGFGMISCAYDDRGNLFVDGDVIGGYLQFAELPAGGNTFTTITLHQSFEFPGSVQWDGKHVAVGDFRAGTLYRFAIAGKKATEVGTTPLDGSTEVSQFFIQGPRVLAASAPVEYAGYVKIYDYPAGGHALRTLSNFSTPIGVVVSARVKSR